MNPSHELAGRPRNDPEPVGEFGERNLMHGCSGDDAIRTIRQIARGAG
jgi:hypothetical protein